MKQIITIYLSALALCVAGLLFFLSTASSDYYQYEAESHSHCLEGESYDPDYGVCYFDFYCQNESECAEIDARYSSVLDSLAREYKNAPLLPHNHNHTAPTRADSAPTAQHPQIQSIVTAIIPEPQRARISRIIADSDGPDGTLAYVEADSDNGSLWLLAYDPVDSLVSTGQLKNPRELLSTIIHEYAHIHTLNETQVRHISSDIDTVECSDSELIIDEGCAYAHAYLAVFTQRFWPEKLRIQAHEAFISGGEEDFAYNLYAAQSQDFVTEYAATNPAEDIAESFTLFVMQSQPKTSLTLADQKILFFYQYPELLSLRQHMRSGLLHILETTQ